MPVLSFGEGGEVMRLNICGAFGLALGLAWLAPTASAQTCDAYFTKSLSLGGIVSDAYDAMNAKDAASYSKLLPALERELNALPATEVKAEACGGNHVNAYTVQQYTELSTLKARGLDTGFPANLPIVKQPDLNQGALAYAVGWLKYEQGNFDGALAAYSKGLAMFPHDANLQNEYLATLIQAQRYKDVIAYADKVLASTFVLEDSAIAKVYHARGVGLWGIDDLDGADEAFTVSLRYNSTDDVVDAQKQVRDAKANQAKKSN